MNVANGFHDGHTAEVARALSCLMDYRRGVQRCHKSCPYAITIGEAIFCDAQAICEDAHSTLVVQDSELKRHDQFFRWLAHLCMKEDDEVSMELICRRLKDLGYIVTDGGVWKEVEQDS